MNNFFISAFFLVGMITLQSCSTDDDSSSNTNNDAQIMQAQSIANTGTWIITNFNDSGQNETSDFNGYTFDFASDGVLTATNGTNTITGTWSVTDDSNSSDDDSSNDDDIDFNIFFPVSESSNFEDLNDDWDIVSVTENRIELRDVSGGNGGIDILVFERN
ncbi:hypothetical protein [uncultured Dokdonia sp.]|uniref:hypothetical protein n=1 Tax=uncultured Dokdonia sp. TaxID=575653 RepID=UPI00262882EB|nr:hypothetical protein [uncultured Dokdonia sp.]